MNATRRLVMVALLTASSLVAGAVESRFPLPFPGMRLGVANVFILTALTLSGPADAAAVAIFRLAASLPLSGNLAAFMCGAGGTACSLPVTLALRKLFPEDLSIPAISTAAAFAFNFGQIAAIAFAFRTPGLFGYLPVLLLAAAVTGFSIGVAAEAVSSRVKESGFFKV